MRSPLFPLLLALSLPASASEPAPLPVDDPPPGQAVVVPLEDRAATDAPQEGIWAWVTRLEGEILSEEVIRSLAEQADARRQEDQVKGSAKPAVAPAKTAASIAGGPPSLNELDPADYDIPLATNQHVQRWIVYFTGKGRGHFQRYLDRSAVYRPMMEAKLEAAGQPKDLIYLAMIESGFNAHAISHAGAGGLWQFMPATGRMYDLRVDWWVDDRRDPLKSTDAAVAHLGDLHRMFKGDWYLAWSAYNAGPGRVRGAIRKGGTTDFWKLVKGGHLPSETANYTPKLIAAAIIAKNAERYGFVRKPATAFAVDTTQVEGAATLGLLAEVAGMSVEDLKALNPGLRRSAVPAEGYALNLPPGKGPSFEQKLAQIPEQERVQFAHHTVRKGETLSKIAAQYGASAGDLVRLNRLKNADRIHVGMALVVPREGAAALAQAAPPPTSKAAPKTAAKATSHTVVAGDTVSGLAQTYGLSTTQLKGWNGLRSDLITPGLSLRLTPPKASAVGGTSSSRSERYTVRKGDTLSAIAARYGVGTAELSRWNKLKSPSSIMVGQTLTIHRTEWRSYKVRPGDSLGRIASENGCSVPQLRAWNELRGDVIQPGQSLRIRR